MIDPLEFVQGNDETQNERSVHFTPIIIILGMEYLNKIVNPLLVWNGP